MSRGGFHPDSRLAQCVAEVVADAGIYARNDAEEDGVIERFARANGVFVEAVAARARATADERLAGIAAAQRAMNAALFAEWREHDARADRGVAEMGATARSAARLLEDGGAEPILGPSGAALDWLAG
jgi:hypothetical protein